MADTYCCLLLAFVLCSLLGKQSEKILTTVVQNCWRNFYHANRHFLIFQ